MALVSNGLGLNTPDIGASVSPAKAGSLAETSERKCGIRLGGSRIRRCASGHPVRATGPAGGFRQARRRAEQDFRLGEAGGEAARSGSGCLYRIQELRDLTAQ